MCFGGGGGSSYAQPLDRGATLMVPGGETGVKSSTVGQYLRQNQRMVRRDPYYGIGAPTDGSNLQPSSNYTQIGR